MTQLDKLILKELDHQRIGGSNYSFILERLNDNDKKFKLLNYLSENRHIILSTSDIVSKVKELQ